MSDLMIMNEDKRFNAFFIELQAKIDRYYNKKDPNTRPKLFSCVQGQRYIKIILESSAYAFIDRGNGDIRAPRRWDAAAKHVRGNINADDYGLSCCGPHEVTRLRAR